MSIVDSCKTAAAAITKAGRLTQSVVAAGKGDCGEQQRKRFSLDLLSDLRQ